MPGAGVASVTALCSTSLWFNLFTFIGLLILPTPSRRATLAADAHLVQKHPEVAGTWADTLRALDRRQDDEPRRTEDIERIFHPVPNVRARIDAIGRTAATTTPWHAARTALFLGLVGLCPMHRVVHCNAGRPELWILLPADG